MNELKNPFNDLVYTNIEDMTDKERDIYLNHVKEENGGTLDGVTKIVAKVDDDNVVHVTYTTESNKKFDRIRRITGYLTGTLDRWNNAKKAEEHDRVKHG